MPAKPAWPGLTCAAQLSNICSLTTASAGTNTSAPFAQVVAELMTSPGKATSAAPPSTQEVCGTIEAPRISTGASPEKPGSFLELPVERDLRQPPDGEGAGEGSGRYLRILDHGDGGHPRPGRGWAEDHHDVVFFREPVMIDANVTPPTCGPPRRGSGLRRIAGQSMRRWRQGSPRWRGNRRTLRTGS